MIKDHQLIDEFVEILSRQLDNKGSTRETILALLKKGLISEKSIRNYLIVKNYPETLRKNNNHCFAATSDLSYKYGISERTVYHILKEKARDYSL